MLLLNVIFSKIRKISKSIKCADHAHDEEKYRTVNTLLDVLKDAHPNGPESPKEIYSWYSDMEHDLKFTFSYHRNIEYGSTEPALSNERDFTLDELYEYFCEVLREPR